MFAIFNLCESCSPSTDARAVFLEYSSQDFIFFKLAFWNWNNFDSGGRVDSVLFWRLVNSERELQSLNIFSIANISRPNFRNSFSRHTSARLHAQWSTLSTYLVNHSVHPFDMVIKEFHCIEFGSAEFQYLPRSYSEWAIEFHSLMPLLWERHFQLLQCKLLQLREVHIMYLWR